MSTAYHVERLHCESVQHSLRNARTDVYGHIDPSTAPTMRLADARAVLQVEPGACVRVVRRAYRQRLLQALFSIFCSAQVG